MGRPPEVTCATPAPAKGRDTTAQGVDAEERLRHLPRVEPAALDRALDALHRLYRGVERLAGEQHVAAGVERGDGDALR